MRTDIGGSTPADSCPFPRPFPADFDGCPAYQPRSLWEAKGRQLEAQQAGRDAASLTRGVREAAERIRSKLVAFLREHRSELEAAGLPYQACLEIVDAILDRFVTHPSTDVPVGVPAELLSRFPEAVRIFFDPQVGQSSGADANSK